MPSYRVCTLSHQWRTAEQRTHFYFLKFSFYLFQFRLKLIWLILCCRTISNRSVFFLPALCSIVLRRCMTFRVPWLWIDIIADSVEYKKYSVPIIANTPPVTIYENVAPIWIYRSSLDFIVQLHLFFIWIEPPINFKRILFARNVMFELLNSLAGEPRL